MKPELPAWLQRVYDTFLNNVAENRLAHAVLLDASPGWGVEELVQSIASTILEADVDFEVNRNLDLLLIDVAEKARFIAIDQIREASDFLGSTSREGMRKLVVIQQADKMSIPASQALLKILEEPPVDKHLLLVTTKCALLLPTIRSRCQRLVVQPGTEAEVSEYLASRGSDQAKLAEYLDEYGGAPYAASAAADAKTLNLKQKLAQVTRSQAALVPVARDLLREEVDDVLASLAVRHSAFGA